MHDQSNAARLARHTRKTETCWEWTGVRNAKGYGYQRIGTRANNQTFTVHRLAWEAASGEVIPPGRIVCHVCDNPACLRNDGPLGTYEVDGVVYPRYGHLWLGTIGANTRDRDLKGRVARGKRNGRSTHPETTYRAFENIHAATLTADQVIWARERRAAGDEPAALAAILGVTKQTITRIVRRETWAHVE